MSFILRIFDWGCRLGLMNSLINYSGLDIVENELCELDKILKKKISKTLMACS